MKERQAELALQVQQEIDDLARIETSSADTGSSHTISLGRGSRARDADPLARPPETRADSG